MAIDFDPTDAVEAPVDFDPTGAVETNIAPVDRSILEGTVGLNRMSEDEATARLDAWKENAYSTLRSIYKGNFDQFRQNVQSVKDGTRKRPTKMNKEQTEMYGIVSNLIDAKDPTDLSNRMKNLEDVGNKFAPLVTRMGLRKSWQDTYNPASGELESPTTTMSQLGYSLFPNVALRNRDVNAGYGSKALAGIQDVFSIPSRVATGAIEQMSPLGSNLSWSQSIGRPDPYSTGGERLLDFTVSAPIPGGVVEKGAITTGKALSKIPQIGKVVEKAGKLPVLRQVIQETPQEAVLGRFLGNTAPEVGALERIGTEALKGAGQGTAYGVVPSAFMYTNPLEASPEAKSEGIASAVMSPLFGGVLGAIGGAGKSVATKLGAEPKLTRVGEELTGGYRSFERLREATKDMPLTDSRYGVEQINAVNDALEEALIKNAEARDILAKESRPVWTPDIVAKSMKSDILKTPEDISLFPGMANEYDQFIHNVANRFFSRSKSNDGDFTPTMEQLVKARSYLGKLERSTQDADKLNMIRQGKQQVIDYMDELGGKSVQVKSKPASGNIQNIPSVEMTQGNVSNKMTPLYKEMTDIYGIQNQFLDAGQGAESAMRKQASARVGGALDQASMIQDVVNSMNSAVEILNRNNIPSPKGGAWTLDDVDYLTPAVAREVRKRIKGNDGETFGMLISRLTEGASLFSPTAIAYKLSKPALRGVYRGSGIAPTIAEGDNLDIGTPTVEDMPLFTNVKGK